jgi:four helix bundle protein
MIDFRFLFGILPSERANQAALFALSRGRISTSWSPLGGQKLKLNSDEEGRTLIGGLAMETPQVKTEKEDKMATIKDLRVYQQARELEDKVPAVIKQLSEDQLYPLGNSMWRSCVAVAHYLAEAHKYYSYRVKLESLHAARTAAEQTIKYLEKAKEAGLTGTEQLVEDYTGVIKQCWGLIKYLKNRQLAKEASDGARAKDELVAARV